MSNSEEEEDEEDESCHSSSSDTLTCSLPEVNLKNNEWLSFQNVTLYSQTNGFVRMTELRQTDRCLNFLKRIICILE